MDVHVGDLESLAVRRAPFRPLGSLYHRDGICQEGGVRRAIALLPGNVVTPSHVVPQIVEALEAARAGGLTLPLVYNRGGYDRVETLAMLDGAVGISMPDAKFWSSGSAARYAGAADHPERMRAAVAEMQRQVGDLEVVDGLARHGLLVRHLVMPDMIDESLAIFDWLAAEVSPRAHVNVMAQYRPAFHAHEHAAIARRPSPDEVASVRRRAQELGLRLCD